jgi:hypothetical protein
MPDVSARRNGVVKMKKCIWIIMVLIIGWAGLGSARTEAVDLSGYYEGQVTGYCLGMGGGEPRPYWQITNRLRLDLSAELGKDATVGGDVVIMTYHGYTTFNLLDILPEAEVDTIRQLFGSMADQTFSFAYDETDIALDNAFITLYPGPFTFRLGRQQLPWGTGYAWNPTDVFNAKSLMDPTYEKPGQDAIKAEWGFGEAGGITLVLMPGSTWQDSTKVGKGKIHIKGFDISASYIAQAYDVIDVLSTTPQTRETRNIIGGDLVGQIWELGVWAEAAWFTGPQDSESWQAVLGIDTTFEFQTSLMLEYFRDSDGEADNNDYTLSDWIQLGLGQKKNLGRDYVMIMASHPLTDLITGTVLVIVNCNDQSAVFVPSLEYSYSDNLSLSVTGNIFSGISDSEYGGLQGSGGYFRAKAFF